ncbi:MAG: IclR family transcriptional regulator, acetate operon repressor [Gaiellales bacterium]|nr:IclR family transcriptional regulator, acetate operon repressor [Gaiellales bacterium]
MLSQGERSARTRPSGSQAIERAAQLLVLVLEQERPTTLGELARLTELPKSTTSRLVAALERNSLVQRDSARGAIRPGPAVLRFAQRGVDDADLIELAQPVLHALAAETGETINLAILTPTGVNHLVQVDSRHLIGAASWVGRGVALHPAANGKIFLAAGVAELPPGELERFTPHTITDRAHLAGALDTIRAVGYATAIDELEVGLSAVAAPVRGGPNGSCVAALSISGPSFRLGASRLDRLGALLIEQAVVLSTRLGYPTLERGT